MMIKIISMINNDYAAGEYNVDNIKTMRMRMTMMTTITITPS